MSSDISEQRLEQSNISFAKEIGSKMRREWGWSWGWLREPNWWVGEKIHIPPPRPPPPYQNDQSTLPVQSNSIHLNRQIFYSSLCRILKWGHNLRLNRQVGSLGGNCISSWLWCAVWVEYWKKKTWRERVRDRNRETLWQTAHILQPWCLCVTFLIIFTVNF